ncbi:MAG TPA: hypothetical protein VGO64_08315 [Candidatus Limnocylindrales bacterium]|nr:hypothetical protein [Candidatus Limnocylindrales bacterium]
MGSSMVRYKVRPERADENVALVQAVYAELAAKRPDDLHYATFRLPDGVSFMHLVIETDQPGRILGEIDSFKAFTADIERRCDEPPVVTEITLVGSYSVVP